MCVWNEFTKCWTWSMSLYMWIKSTYIVVPILLMQMWILFICPITSFQPFPSVESTFIYLAYHEGFGVCSFFSGNDDGVTSIAVCEGFGVFLWPSERTASLCSDFHCSMWRAKELHCSPFLHRMASLPANIARPPTVHIWGQPVNQKGGSCSS
jgi:hypothetical protein